MRTLIALFAAVIAMPLWADPSTTSVQQGAAGGLQAKFIVATSTDKQSADRTFQYWVAMPNPSPTKLVLELGEIVFSGKSANDPGITCNVLDCFGVGFDPFRIDNNETLFVTSNREILSFTLNSRVQNTQQPLATLVGLFTDCDEDIATVKVIFGNNYRTRSRKTRVVMASFGPVLQTGIVPKCIR